MISAFSITDEYRKALLQCKVCAAIAIAIFACILTVEGAILLPSYQREKARLENEMELTARAYIDGLVHAGHLVSTFGDTTLSPPHAVKAMIVESVASGTMIAHRPDLLSQTATESDYYLQWQIDSGPEKLTASVLLDRRMVEMDLNGFVLRIIGLVLLIAAAATAVAMLVVGKLILFPLLRTEKAVFEASANTDSTKLPPIRNIPFGELGRMAVSINRLFEAIAESNREKKERLEFSDPTTGLFNRRALVREIKARNLQGEELFAFIIDIDSFGRFNDWFGHAEGEELLKVVAGTIVESCEPGDIVARYVGDEFAVISNRFKSTEEASRFAETLLKACEFPMEIHGRELLQTASCGIALSRHTGQNVDTLLDSARRAAHRANRDGGGKVRFLDDELDGIARRHRTLERGLQRALVRDEFDLVYQPKFNVATGEMVGAEALLRWQMEGEENISPAEFIPIAEDSGVISEVGQWVLRHAAQDIAEWRRRNPGACIPRIAINVSPIQFRDTAFVARLMDILKDTGLAANNLEMEITEGAFISDLDYAMSLLNEVGRLGIRTSIDDFGTGFSSLSYLRALPIHSVKIDKSFIDSLTEDADSRRILESIVSLAHALDLESVAEGVETEEQLDILRRMECSTVQGYLLGKPMPAHELCAMIAECSSKIASQSA